MTRSLEYHVVDVFTDRAFAGNPLAVVLGADGVPAGSMQALAREFHLSETAFPLHPDDAERARGVDYRIRIFTPEVEMPFAGHPSIGTAWLLARLGLVRPGVVVQACGAGDLPLLVDPDGGPVELTGGVPVASGPIDPSQALAAVGLGTDDLEPGRQARRCSAGVAYVVLPVRADALGRCRPDLGPLRQLTDGDGSMVGVYVTAWSAAELTARARMFAGDLGAPEDPATGSAALALGPWLAAEGLAGDGAASGSPPHELSYVVTQGVELGRPSTMACRVEVAGRRAVAVHVRGAVVPVAEGRVTVPG